MLLVAWGQYLDHDITLTGETKDSAGKTPKCCQEGIGARAHPECMPIDIPHNDEFYAQYGRKCLNFVRNLVGRAFCSVRFFASRLWKIVARTYIYVV